MKDLGNGWRRGGGKREPREGQDLRGGERRGRYKGTAKGKRKETCGGSIYARWMMRRHCRFLTRRTKGNTQRTH